jgi:hypothetical protein
MLDVVKESHPVVMGAHEKGLAADLQKSIQRGTDQRPTSRLLEQQIFHVLAHTTKCATWALT